MGWNITVPNGKNNRTIDLVERHARQIFPLFHQRRLFAGVENFLLYDFYTATGNVNEDVFAFSNQLGDQHGLVIYHNRFGDTRGLDQSFSSLSDRTTKSWSSATWATG